MRKVIITLHVTSAFLRVEHPFAHKFEFQICLACLQLVVMLGKTLSGIWSKFLFDMSSASGYMGAQCVQEFGPICLHMSSASGYMSATRFQEFAARFLKKSAASGYMGAK